MKQPGTGTINILTVTATEISEKVCAMETKWLTDNYTRQRLVLAADIGGTNTNIGLVSKNENDFVLIAKFTLKTNSIKKFTDCFKSVLAQILAKNAELVPDVCCLSTAGPIENNRCELSSIEAIVDAGEIGQAVGTKTIIINDFSAISYALPLVDVNDKTRITALRHIDGSIAAQSGSVRAVAGAGTGLGVGILMERGNDYFVCPSEGGHIAFSCFDEQSRELHEYIAGRFGELMESQLFVSGVGIKNIFYFFKEAKKVAMTGCLKDIDEANDADKPAMIADCANENEVCRDIIRLFVECYGRFAGDVASFIVPTMGLYLAGGIAGKNEKYFIEDDLFMRYFEGCYHPGVKKILKTIPVYIIRDYSVSLYGAANAACRINDNSDHGGRG
ncbi:MAG: glucokinase [Phycisphaerae bacterium]|nr:glucokinase [Phycisphaerae bacterium]